MKNFEYYNPTRVLFGKDRLGKIDKLIPADANVLITLGGGSARRSGLVDKVRVALGNRKIFEFEGIEPNPSYETLMKAVEVVRKEQIDFILAVGGGSILDGTKFICLAAHYSGECHKLLMYGFKPITPDIVENVVPFGAVLTLPASGSEMNNIAVISYKHNKLAVRSERSFPNFSILDPTYTFTLPEVQVANGVIDAFVHIAEQYLTYPVDARVPDRMSEGVLQTLIEVGETTVNEPENYEARANHMWAATTALNGMLAVGVPQDWTAHMIGHELTSLFGIDHGQTLAIVYPAVLEVRREAKRAKLLQYAERVWDIDTGNEDEKIDLAIQKTRTFFENLGIKTRLSDYGVKADQITDVIGKLEALGLTALSETRDVTPDISRKILEAAL